MRKLLKLSVGLLLLIGCFYLLRIPLGWARKKAQSGAKQGRVPALSSVAGLAVRAREEAHVEIRAAVLNAFRGLCLENRIKF